MADQQLHQFNTGVDGWSVVVDHYGNGKGTREQFDKSTPQALEPVIDGLRNASDFAKSSVHDEIGRILTNLQAAWRGENADQAVQTLQSLQTDAMSVSHSTGTISSSLETFRKAWVQLKGQASQLGDDDDAGAKRIFNEYIKAENDCKDPWPNTLYYHDPLTQNGQPGGVPGGVPGGGPGGYPGGFPGHYPGPGGIPGSPGNFPGHYPGNPGNYPGHYPGPGYPGGYPGHAPGGYPGSYPGSPGGAGVDTSSTLAGYDPTGGAPGGMGGVGGGSAGGLGSGGGLGAGGGLAGAGAGGGGLGAAGGLAGTGGGGAAGGAAAGGRSMMAPMHAGGQGDESERERTTWLTEDDDPWGMGEDAAPGIIQ